MKIGAIGAFLSLAVWADHGGKNNNNNNQNEDANGSFESSVVGSTPGATIGGVNSGGAPWVAANGEASVSPSGKLEVDVRGLLLGPGAPANLVGTVGPVQMVAASLVCGGSGGVVVAATPPIFLNASGNARIENTVTIPASCL